MLPSADRGPSTARGAALLRTDCGASRTARGVLFAPLGGTSRFYNRGPVRDELSLCPPLCSCQPRRHACQ
jgi:hypothetical protein